MNVNATLFDRLKLDPYYPKEDYGKDPRRILLFLIACNNSTVSIVKYIKETVLPKFPDRLNCADLAVRKVTALHLAVMKERLDIITELLEAGADPNARDEKGWTPYHLIALAANSAAIQQVFAKYPVERGLKTAAGDTYDDLLVQTGKIPQKYGMAKTFIEKDGQLIPLTEANLTTVGLESYTDSVLFSPEMVAFLWNKKYEPVDNLTQEYEKLYANLPIKHPKVVIAEDVEISTSSGKKCLGLKAGEAISCGTAIRMYAGAIIPQRQSNFFDNLENDNPSDAYDFGYGQGDMSIQPFKRGNAARFMNDGVPNVGLRYVPGKGIIAVALRDIAEAEFLYFNYETCPRVKWLGSFLKDKKALLEFYKQGSLNEIIDGHSVVKPVDAPLQERWEDLRWGVLKTYPLWTPSAMVFLSLTKTTPAKDWLTLFEDRPFFEIIKAQLKNDVPLICWTLSMLDELKNFEFWLNKLEQTASEDAAKIRDFCLGMLDKPIPNLLFAFCTLQKTYKKGEKIEDYLLKLSRAISDYNWRTSPIIFLPRAEKQSNGQMGMVINERDQHLYKKYHLI